MREGTDTLSKTKHHSANMFRCKPGTTCVLYKDEEYECASDALEAYMLDYEKKEQKYPTKNKYEREVQDLLCPKVKTKTSSWLDHGKAETESTIARIVRESYHKLQQADREAVQDSMSATMKLMKRLENDRLPSPTRTMQPGGRPSTCSVDTDTLLDARPTVPILPVSEITKSQERSSYKGGSKVEEFYTLHTPHYSQNYNSSHALSTGRVPSADDTLRSHSNSVTGHQTGSGLMWKKNCDVQDPSLQWGRIKQNSLSNLSHQMNMKGSNNLDEIPKSIDKLDKMANQPTLSHSIESNRAGSECNFKQKVSGLSTKDTSVGEVRSKTIKDQSVRAKNNHPALLGNANKRPFGKGVSQKPGIGKNLQGSYLEMASGAESDGTTSSIITGHMNKGALPHKPGLTIASSTPKRDLRGSQGTKQLRFDLDTTSKSSIGQGLELNDLNTRQSRLGQSPELEASFDLSKVQTGRQIKANFAAERENGGILKTVSPGRKEGAMSNVSFTTDDLLTCNPSGFTPPRGRKPRSKSVPRPSSSDPSLLLDKTGMHVLRNPFDKTGDISMDRSSRYSQMSKGDPCVSRNDTSLRDVKEAKYKEFLKGLMEDIDDSSSSVVTQGEKLHLSHNAGVQLHGDAVAVDNNTGGGYLERIQRLLSGVPSMSEFLKSDDTQDSLTTEAVLEGDRTWENLPSFKPLEPVSTEGVDAPSNNLFEDFMAECMAEAKSKSESPVSTPDQPGPLEALKNMLFTVQSLGTSVKCTEDSHPDSEEGSGSGEMVDFPLNDSISKLLSPETKKLLSGSYSQGAPSLNKAMEHLTKLKDLVHSGPDELQADNGKEADIYDIT